MKIWLRTASGSERISIDKPFEAWAPMTGVRVVFSNLYRALKELSFDVTLHNPQERCIEVWWGLQWEPEENNNFKVGFTPGETYFERKRGFEHFDIFFVPRIFEIIFPCF